MKTKYGALTIVLVFLGGMATGQTPTQTRSQANANQPPAGFDVSSMFSQMYDGLFTYLAKPETAKKLARFQKSYYDALIEEGFSKEDALRIICSAGIPTMGSK